MKNRSILKTVFVWLLTVAMLAVCIPTSVFAAGEEDINDSLLIHYNFEGDTLEDQLADKAGDVETDLYAYFSRDGVPAIYSEGEGLATDWFKFQDGVVSAGMSFSGATTNLALASQSNTDTQAIHKANAPTALTLYLRVQITDWNKWTTLFSMRNTASNVNNRPLHIETDGNGNLKVYTGASSNASIAATDIASDSEGWTDLAVVRTPAAAADGYDSFAIYNKTTTGWVELASYTNADKHSAYNTDTLILCLFASANGSYGGTNQTNIKYDDVRIYEKALTIDQLAKVSAEVNPTLGAGVTSTAGEMSTSLFKSNLMIHYDFEGSDWDTILSDKAGTTNSKLYLYKGASESTPAISSEAPNTALTNKDGVLALPFNWNGLAAVATESTVDTQAIHDDENPTGLTLYLRMQITNWNLWTQVFNMRNTATGNRPLHIELDGTGNLKVYTGASSNASIAATDIASDSEGWTDLAVVRTPAAAADGYDSFAIYNKTTTGWVELASYTNADKHSAYNTDTMLLSLFASANGTTYSGTNQSNVKYDDVRVYNTALSVSDLNALAGFSVNMLGAQRSKNTFDGNTTYKVRLVAEINGNAWANAGFKVSINSDGTDLGTADLAATAAYTSLLAEENGGLQVEVTASEGKYLIAVVIEGIPVANDNMTLTVTPYVGAAGETVNGDSVVVTLKNAQIESIAWAN